MCEVTEEEYLGEGLMVKHPDKAQACLVAEKKAAELGRELQNTTPMSLLRDDAQHWFFPYKP